MKKWSEINYDLGVARVDIFSTIYPLINKLMMENAPLQESRYGDTKEILNFKTEIANPIARCTGGYGRDINVFFLLAEALWIWSGRKDVGFLTKFNSRMGEFSDDGEVFHAPYGHRLREYNSSTKNWSGFEPDYRIEFDECDPIDQIENALMLLKQNPDDRRVVLSVWNPSLDLGTKSKDIPCNDLLMYKIRNGGLHLTIANRSNDLHWGLPTNVFQFSFISEIISKILNVKFVNQVHNSHSLHLYTENEIPQNLYRNFEDRESGEDTELYRYCKWSEMDFNFPSDKVAERLEEIDELVNFIIEALDEGKDLLAKDRLIWFSSYLYKVYSLLALYLEYKQEEKTDEIRHKYLIRLSKMYEPELCGDYVMLAMNFFAKRIKSPEKKGALDSIRMAFPNIGRF